MQIEHIIFLIHPCCYEPLSAEDVRRDNLQLYVDLEKEIKGRWFQALAERPPNTLLLQLGGPEELCDQAVEYLGQAAVFYPQTSFPDNADLAEYYRRLTVDFHVHIAAHGLSFNPATITSELWGESFEGCVPGYGGALAQYLGLALAPKMRFEMTVYDSRFLAGAKIWEVVPIAGSDVEAWIFECYDGTGAAMFQARQTAQWIDRRRIELQLDDRRLQVCTKQGHTIWPKTPWEKGVVEAVRPYSMLLQECIWCWIRAVGMPMDDFRRVLGQAQISAAEE
ncbi:MAG: hypothetical protein GKR89_26530 [Candidatus Latescibacteria bacterium]|nr:hypothetical protein [Candidatus Latescibacterota bacterium]